MQPVPQQWRRLKHPGGRRLGCSCGAMLLTWASAPLVFCPIAVVLVGLFADGDDTAIIVQQAVAAFFVAILVFVLGILVGRGYGVYKMTRPQPCPQCGTKPLEELSGDSRLLSCRRCLVTWEVEAPILPTTHQSTDHSGMDVGPPI